MKYSIQKLIENPQHDKFLFFWGHQPSKDGTITKACFSQWWLSSFTADGILFKTAEHWMMAKKALLFKDQEIYDKIIQVNSPAEAKKLGREIQNYNETIWQDQRYSIVLEGNFHKFSQNENLKNFILNTKDRILVEASPVDPIWGIGLPSDHENCIFPKKWRGLNLLGFALMEVRDQLKD